MSGRRWIPSALALLILASAPSAIAEPILDPLGTTLPRYQGAPASAEQLAYTKAPRNPFMAPNPRSNIHNDTWMTDAYRWAGPAWAARPWRSRTQCRLRSAGRSRSTRAGTW